MSQILQNNVTCNQETQTFLTGSPPYITESPSNSYLISNTYSNNANSDLIAGISNFCVSQGTGVSEENILSQEFRQKLWTLFRQVEIEFERECKRISSENYTGHERNEKVESSDHEETNFAKKISGSHISQKIKQQYKQSKQSTHRFVSTLRDRGSGANAGAVNAQSSTIPSVSGGITVGANSSATPAVHSSTRRPTCELVWRATEHRDGIWEVNTIGRSVVGTACADGVVRLWNAENGRSVLIYLGHSGSVNSVRFKNGIMLTASGDGTAHLIKLPADKLEDTNPVVNKSSVADGDDDYHGGTSSMQMDEHSSSFKKSVLSGEDNNDDQIFLPTVLRNPDALYQTASLLGPLPMTSPTSTQSSIQCAMGLSNNVSGNCASDTAFGAAPSLSSAPNVTSGLGPAFVPYSAAAAYNYPPDSGQLSGLMSFQDSAPLSAADFLLSRDQIVTASWDRLGRIYDIATGSEVSTLTGHDLPLTDVRTSSRADHCLAVTTSRDCTFRLWDFRCAATEVHIQQGHNGVVSCVNFVDGTSGSEKLLSAGADRYCKLWDLRHNRTPLKEYRTDSPINRLAVHPSGKIVALPMDNRTIKLIELSVGNRVARFPRSSSQNHSRIVTSVSWTNDGLGKPNLFSVGFDHLLLAWNIQLSSTLF